MKRSIYTTKNKNSGFTLVELMVSLAVFSIVMLISTGVLLIMIDVNAKGQALYSSYSNLAFALDSMTREIRTGRNYYCTTTSGNGDTSFSNDSARDCSIGSMIVFNKGWSNERLGYRLSEGRIEQRLGSSEWFPITGDEVEVTSLNITVANTGTSNDGQPSVAVSVVGNLFNGLSEPTSFDISTRVLQRILDR